MSIRTIHSTEKDWFISFTCYQWLPLLEIVKGYDLVYQWFDYLRAKNLADILSYVIMPNHLHAIIHLSGEEKNLNTLVSNGKRFMAYQIIKRLKDINENAALLQLENGVGKTDKQKGQKT